MGLDYVLTHNGKDIHINLEQVIKKSDDLKYVPSECVYENKELNQNTDPVTELLNDEILS